MGSPSSSLVRRLGGTARSPHLRLHVYCFFGISFTSFLSFFLLLTRKVVWFASTCLGASVRMSRGGVGSGGGGGGDGGVQVEDEDDDEEDSSTASPWSSPTSTFPYLPSFCFSPFFISSGSFSTSTTSQAERGPPSSKCSPPILRPASPHKWM